MTVTLEDRQRALWQLLSTSDRYSIAGRRYLFVERRLVAIDAMSGRLLDELIAQYIDKTIQDLDSHRRTECT